MSLRYSIRDSADTKTYIYFKPTENTDLDDIKMLLGSEGSIEVYDDAEGSDPNNSYKNVKDYIYRIITSSEFLCKGLNPEYILDSFDEVDAVVIVGSTMNILPNGNVFGFALIKFEERTNSLYIDVICSHVGIKGAGELLINQIGDICSHLFITKVQLKSVKSAISFYEKYGFIKTGVCKNLCLMEKSIRTTAHGKRTKTKAQKKSKRNRKFRSPRKTMKRNLKRRPRH
jgi:hypothetical protein